MKQGWEKKKLPDVLWFQEGPGVRKHQYVSEGIKLLNVANLVNGKLDLSTSDRYISIDEAYGKYKHFLVDEGDLILASSGIQVEYIEKKMGFVQKEHLPLCMNTSTIRFKTLNKNVLNIEYFMYFLKSYEFKRQLFSLITGCAQLNYGPSHLKQMVVPVPPIAEQEKIVAELDCLSGIIEKKKQQLKELDNLAQSIFYEMFGDPVENDKGWEKKRLDEIGKVITGNTPSTKDESNYSSADYCFVKPSDIAKDSISYISNTEFYVSEKAYINSRQLPKGSVLTTCIGIIGKVGILQKDATCNQQINAIIPNKDIDAKFLAHVLFMIRDVLTDVANAPIVPIINKKEFSSVSIPVPLFSLQQDFASKIESIEKQKELIAQSIKETETLFNSRMDYYFN